MKRLTIAMPDTEAVRYILDGLATLAAEDEAEHFDGEASMHSGGTRKQAEERAQACRDFAEAVNAVIHPETVAAAIDS